MNEPYQKYLELSVVHFMAFPEVMMGAGPIIETLEMIAHDPFFTAIEVGPIKDKDVRERAAKLLAQSHMKVGFGAQPIVLANKLNPNSPQASERGHAMEKLKDAVHQAVELGARRMALLSGPNPPEEDRKEQRAILADFLHELSIYAENEGLLGLTLETFDYDVDKKALVGPNQEAAALARDLRREHPHFGLLVDLSHLPLQRETIDEGLEAVADVLVHAHIGNCVLDPDHGAYGDQHPGFGVVGGENDTDEVVAFIEKLFQVGFLGKEARPFLGFEVKPQTGQTSRAVLAGSKRVFLEAWARAKTLQPQV